ncbi:DUF2514 family protein [Aeromonas sp. 31P]
MTPSSYAKAAPYVAGGLVVAILLGSGLALYQYRYSEGYRAGEQDERHLWQAKWDRQAAELAAAKARNLELAREEEQRRQNEIEKVRRDAEQDIARAEADAAAANAVAGSLREQARRLASRASQCAGNPGTAQGGSAAGQSALVLADLLSRADARAGELAAAYDRARAAGLACERAYDALSATKPRR